MCTVRQHKHSYVCAEWLTGARENIMTWSASPISHHIILQSQLASPVPLTESAGQANDGTLYYAMQHVSYDTLDRARILSQLNMSFQLDNMTYQIGSDVALREYFAENGILQNTVDSQFRNITEYALPVTAVLSDSHTILATGR